MFGICVANSVTITNAIKEFKLNLNIKICINKFFTNEKIKNIYNICNQLQENYMFSVLNTTCTLDEIGNVKSTKSMVQWYNGNILMKAKKK